MAINKNIQAILDLARKQIGIKEEPAGTNNVVYNTHFYGRDVFGSTYPWCCAFVWDIFRMCGLSKLFCGGTKTAYCPYVEQYYRKAGRWYLTGEVGDIVLFDFNGKGLAGHIGIVEKVNADGSYTTIEGNTSTSNNANGGAVMRRTRKKSVIRGFARPDYESGAVTSVETVKTTTTPKTGGKIVNITLNQLSNGDKGKQVQTLQRLLEAFGFSVGDSGTDGDFGPATLKAVKAFQKGNSLTVDGIVGTKTWEKLLK